MTTVLNDQTVNSLNGNLVDLDSEALSLEELNLISGGAAVGEGNEACKETTDTAMHGCPG